MLELNTYNLRVDTSALYGDPSYTIYSVRNSYNIILQQQHETISYKTYSMYNKI
jgi:hypothetical protein